MGMTIDESITRYKSNAEYERTHGNLQGCLEFRQLAEWLKQYQELKADYENRLKADMVAMLTEIQLEIEEKEQYYQDKFLESKNAVHDAAMGGRMFGCGDCKEIIQQKIDKLKGVEE